MESCRTWHTAFFMSKQILRINAVNHLKAGTFCVRKTVYTVQNVGELNR